MYIPIQILYQILNSKIVYNYEKFKNHPIVNCELIFNEILQVLWKARCIVMIFKYPVKREKHTRTLYYIM